MILSISGANQSYLADLNLTQQQINQDTAEVSSGLAVREPSDDPAAVASILQTQADIGLNQQIQSNLSSVSAELQTADSALQSAVQAVQTAITLAAQGGTATSTAANAANLATQVAGLQQTLVGISQTTFNGRYIFSGDQDTGPMYQLDSSQPDGVEQLFTTSSTRVIVDSTGTAISVGETAQQIFSAQNPDGSDASGNVFAAMNSLYLALTNTSLSSSDQQAAITQAGSALQSASTYLNQQVAYYGEAEDSIASANDLAQKFQTQEQAQLSNLRDADIPTVATQLTEAQNQQQAAISAEAEIQQDKNLFNYLV